MKLSKDFFVHDAGKGSRQRNVDKKKFDENWDKIFGKKEEKDAKQVQKSKQ